MKSNISGPASVVVTFVTAQSFKGSVIGLREHGDLGVGRAVAVLSKAAIPANGMQGRSCAAMVPWRRRMRA